ncbi:unnamed protein product [Durusdinium trenchii]|uniref:Pseudouridine synthase RsuA/RluA-like domain-containing protein n=1 Tax=Durusdinium trenchii TaxID=1381693 RepID=A0ABP0J3V4_9DINO
MMFDFRLSPRSYGSDGARHPTFAFGIVHAFRLLGRLSPSLFQAAEGVCRDWAARKDRGRPSRLGRPAAGETAPQPHLLHDEQHVCVLAKPAGWTVSVSHSSGSEPVVLRQAQKGPQLQNWIMEKMENPIAMDVSAAHGLLHRLDRGTSGLILCAKTYLGFYLSQLEFEARRLRKTYLCICEGHAPTPPFLLEAPLATRGGRAFVSTRGKHAQTEVVEVSHLLDEVGQPCSLLEVRLHTGRLHQIRAHLSSIGHAIRGDASYGGTKGPRVLLHASRLQIDLRGLGSSIDVTAALPEDFSAALEAMVPCSQKCASIVKQQSRADSRAMQSGVKDGSFTCVTSVTRCFTFKLSGCGLCRALALTAFCS